MSEEKKAYALSLLVDKLKARGLPATEALAMEAFDGVMDYLEESAKLSDSGWFGSVDDLMAKGYPWIRNYVKKDWIDKIDGVDDIKDEA